MLSKGKETHRPAPRRSPRQPGFDHTATWVEAGLVSMSDLDGAM